MKVVSSLQKFAATVDAHFSGHFELCDGDVMAWFDGDAKIAKQFRVFGREPDGSLYALWRHKGRTWANAPVVYFNSENDGNTLVATNVEDFLALLALDIGELGFWIDGADAWATEAIESRDDKAEPAPCIADYRAWLNKTLNRKAPSAKQADKMVASAHEAHPSFSAFLDEVLGEEPVAEAPPAAHLTKAMLTLELACSRDAVETLIAELFAAIVDTLPPLDIMGRIKPRGARNIEDDYASHRRLPDTFDGLSEYRIVMKRDGEQVVCIVVEAEDDAFRTLLWLKPPPSLDPQHAALVEVYAKLAEKYADVRGRFGDW